MGEKELAKKVAERAYQLFLKRGGKHGYHQQDWLQAEKDMRAPEVKVASKPAKAAAVAEKLKKAKTKKSKK